jgi:hypothetical protein
MDFQKYFETKELVGLGLFRDKKMVKEFIFKLLGHSR